MEPATSSTNVQKGRTLGQKLQFLGYHVYHQGPSEREKLGHETSGHAVFRSWRVHCVGVHASARREAELLDVGVDDGYFGKDRQRTMPLLLARDRRTQMLAGPAVESKVRDDYSTSFMAAFVPNLEWKRLLTRSDDGP